MYVIKRSKLLLLALYITCCVIQSVLSRKDFSADEAIKIINKVRKVHLKEKQYELSRDYNLVKNAASIVKKAVKNKGFGDEISAGVNTYQVCATFGALVTAKQVVTAWYDEVCQDQIDFKSGSFENAESFSQLVWKDTQKVGIAKAIGKKDNQTCQYIAAVFRPPGNIEGFFTENVMAGTFNQQKYCDSL